jgi:hypothetical protein
MKAALTLVLIPAFDTRPRVPLVLLHMDVPRGISVGHEWNGAHVLPRDGRMERSAWMRGSC